MRNLCLALCAIATIAHALGAAEISEEESEGLVVFSLKQGGTRVRIAPSAGANVFSIEVDGVEYLRQPTRMHELAGVGFGNPVLYPTPNRVKNAAFTFQGQRVQFQANAGPNFIHGLVNRHPWQVTDSNFDETSATLRMAADFRTNTTLHLKFPFPHQLFLSVRVSESTVRWTYEVDNSDGITSIPFGFALHPYFLYQGSRADTYLNIPATHWMESNRQLPSGRLVPAADLDFPLNAPMSLAGTQFDDVFFGISPQTSTTIDFRGAMRKISIAASEEFTHLVVWTPDRPYFGVESQTCSTDAHNLFAAGFVNESHLQICPPGKKMSGWVEYRIHDAN